MQEANSISLPVIHLPSDAHILVIDDDEDHVVLIQQALKNFLKNLQIDICSNGIEALNCFQKNIKLGKTYDFVLLDINMPLMDGYDLIKKIRMEKSIGTVPVIALTSTESPELLHKAYQIGANTVILKETFFDPSHPSAELLLAYWYHLAFSFKRKVA